MREQPPSTERAPLDAGSPHPTLGRYYHDGEARREYLHEAFDRSAHHYDGINRWMSFGTDSWYRRKALERAGVGPGMKLLDVGCGTGMIASHARDLVGETGQVIAVDPSFGMLRQGIAEGRLDSPARGRAEALPFPDQHFDLVTMSYALRHVDNLETTFSEYRRVLRPGGKILILEVTPPPPGPLFGLVKFYLRRIVPAVTRVTTGSRDAQTLYAYCWDTFEACVPPEEIQQAMTAVGMTDVSRHREAAIFSEYTGVR